MPGELAGLNISVFAIDPGPADTGWLAPESKVALERQGRLSMPADVSRKVRQLVVAATPMPSGQIIRLQA